MARELFGLTNKYRRRTLILKLFWFSAFQIKSCTKLILDQNACGKYKQMRGRKEDLCGRGVCGVWAFGPATVQSSVGCAFHHQISECQSALAHSPFQKQASRNLAAD
jgi:hypothetical protein